MSKAKKQQPAKKVEPPKKTGQVAKRFTQGAATGRKTAAQDRESKKQTDEFMRRFFEK